MQRSTSVGSPLRRAALTVLVVALTGAAAVELLQVARTAWASIRAAGPASPADGLLLVVGLAGAVLALWFALTVLLAALAALPGRAGERCRSLAERLAPVFARRMVALVLGSTLTTVALPTAALATPAPVAAALRTSLIASSPTVSMVADGWQPPVQPAASSAVPDPALKPTPVAEPAPSWTPTRPSRPPRVADPARSTLGVLQPDRAAGHRPAEEEVVVRRGDSLWDIASRHLGAEATATEIAHEWPRWYAANRSRIGDDPDLIVPGQRLVPPETERAAR